MGLRFLAIPRFYYKIALDVYKNQLVTLRNLWVTEIKSADEAFASLKNPISGFTVHELRLSHQYASDPTFRSAVDRYAEIRNHYESLADSIILIDRAIARLTNRSFSTESMQVSEQTAGPPQNLETKENLVDMGGDESQRDVSGLEMDSYLLSRTDLSLADFLNRPLEIATFTWSNNTNTTTTYDPWTLYLSAPSVRAKLKNYAFLYADLNIRITMSGTPFHMGKLLAAYVPQCTLNTVSNYYYTNISTSLPNSRKYFSQIHGSVVMDPKDNIPTDLSCPFISTKRAIRLFNNSTTALAAGTAYADASNLGRLILISINNLACVSTSPSNVNVFVYAWLSNVQLGPPTGTQIAVTTESMRDEQTTGPVQRFASSAAEVADALTVVPTISPFARAGSIVLRGLASLSSLFGWSAPVIDVMPHRVKNEPFQNAANLIQYDTGKKLTMDPKQGLTVDPRVCAISEDDMSLAAVCRTTSLLDSFTWFSTSNVLSPLWTGMVNPRINVPDIVATHKYVQPTALHFAATPFFFWRGDITYRIEIVCSKFHRGKIGILYEPNVAQQALINSSLQTNKQYLHTFDIQETQTCEFTVEWGFTRHWARVCDDASSITGAGSVLASPSNFWNMANGYITIVPITKLQSPDASAVGINVYVRSDNMHFNVPVTTYLPTNLTTESGCASSYGLDPCVINPSISTTKGLNELHFGEAPLSFRSLLKRFALTQNIDDSFVGTGTAWFSVQAPIIPEITPVLGGTAATTNLLSYLRYAYLAMRGSLRKRIRVIGLPATGHMERTNISLVPPTVSVTTPSFVAALQPYGPRLNGTVEYITSTNGGIECEIPFYTNNLYCMSGNNTPWDTGDAMNESYALRDYLFELEGEYTANELTFLEETATGEDFSLIRYISAPPCYYA